MLLLPLQTAAPVGTAKQMLKGILLQSMVPAPLIIPIPVLTTTAAPMAKPKLKIKRRLSMVPEMHLTTALITTPVLTANPKLKIKRLQLTVPALQPLPIPTQLLQLMQQSLTAAQPLLTVQYTAAPKVKVLHNPTWATRTVAMQAKKAQQLT